MIYLQLSYSMPLAAPCCGLVSPLLPDSKPSPSLHLGSFTCKKEKKKIHLEVTKGRKKSTLALLLCMYIGNKLFH